MLKSNVVYQRIHRDYISSLSTEERVNSLVDGYIRRVSEHYVIAEISILCQEYFGRPRNANKYAMHILTPRTSRKLKTLKESGHDCCGRNTCCPRTCRNLCSASRDFSVYCCQYWQLYVIIVWLLILLGKDIASICVALIYDCDNAVSEFERVILDVTSWMLVAGCSTLLSFSFMFCCGYIDRKIHQSDGVSLAFTAAFAFVVTWTVFGFMFMNNLDAGHPCTKMVKFWSYSESILIGMLCCSGCLTMIVNC